MKKLETKEWIAISLAILVVGYFFFFSGKKEESNVDLTSIEDVVESKDEVPKESTQEIEIKKETIKKVNTQINMNELQIETTKEGTGTGITTGQTAEVNYTGMLLDGTVFDSSIPRGQTFEFRLGEGRVIAGWEEGVKGMKVGEKRKLTIPGSMAYGSNGIPNGQGGFLIPPNATLVFEVELVSIK